MSFRLKLLLFLNSSSVKVQDSHAYRNAGMTRECMDRILSFSEIVFVIDSIICAIWLIFSPLTPVLSLWLFYVQCFHFSATDAIVVAGHLFGFLSTDFQAICCGSNVKTCN